MKIEIKINKKVEIVVDNSIIISISNLDEQTVSLPKVEPS
jgi:hypothetical protein